MRAVPIKATTLSLPTSPSNELRASSQPKEGGSPVTERISQWDIISRFGNGFPGKSKGRGELLCHGLG